MILLSLLCSAAIWPRKEHSSFEPTGPFLMGLSFFRLVVSFNSECFPVAPLKAPIPRGHRIKMIAQVHRPIHTPRFLHLLASVICISRVLGDAAAGGRNQEGSDRSERRKCLLEVLAHFRAGGNSITQLKAVLRRKASESRWARRPLLRRGR